MAAVFEMPGYWLQVSSLGSATLSLKPETNSFFPAHTWFLRPARSLLYQWRLSAIHWACRPNNFYNRLLSLRIPSSSLLSILLWSLFSLIFLFPSLPPLLRLWELFSLRQEWFLRWRSVCQNEGLWQWHPRVAHQFHFSSGHRCRRSWQRIHLPLNRK